MGASVAIHVNPGLTHQRETGKALLAGFCRHGFEAIISTRRETEADIHVVNGPWFALSMWRFHPRTLYIDRAFWGDPECVSAHWLRDGEKARTGRTEPRDHPDFEPYREGSRSIYLCDYGEGPAPGRWDAIRHHPANGQASPLRDALGPFQIAGGRRTTALIDAALMGLRIETDDPHSPAWEIRGGGDREPWLNRLAWHNWNIENEIASGDFLDGLGYHS
jgi:hypothetical protein